MKNQKKKYLHKIKIAKKLAALALVATTLVQPTFGLVNAASVYAQEAAAPAANRDVKRTPIPFKTIYEEDPTLEAGQKRTRVKGVEGFKEVITSTTPDVAAVAGKGNGVLNFTTKAKVTENTSSSTKHEPMDLIQIIDLSGSLSDGEYKQRNGVSGARRQQINDMIYVIEHQLTDEDHVMLAFYGTNKGNSYVVGGQDGGIATKLMTKKEAIALLNKINAEKQVHEVAQSWTLIPNVIKPLLENYAVSDAQDGTGFEDVYKSQSNRNKVVSVLQFTDNWTQNEKEDIDTTFAEWAKSTAKTFMTVVDDPDPDNSLSVSQMKKAGHPNIKTFRSLTDSNRQEEIAKLFQSTATVTTKTTTKGEDQTAKITIGGDGVKVLTARLKGAVNKELAIKDGKVDVSEKLADGAYSVEFTAEGNGTLTAKVAVDGKDVDNKTVTLKETAGKKGTSTTDENVTPAVDEVIQVGTKPVTKESATPFKTIYEEDKELEAGKKVTKQEGSAGSGTIVTTYTLNKETGEVTPKEEKSDKPAQDQIIKVGTKPTVVETKTAYETIEEKDPTLPEGERKVKTPGKDGIKTVTTTYTLNTENGEVTPKEDVQDDPKVDEVILVGTMKKALPVTLRFFNRDKGTFLKDDQKITTETSKFDDEFTLNPDKEIKDGEDTYRLVEIKVSKTEGTNGAKLDGLSEDKKSLKGKVSETEQMYDAIYERVVSTHFVDKDGKELEKAVEGVQDKKEIKGYNFVTTRKLQNGDIEHVYEKPATPLKGETPKAFAKTGESVNWILTSLGLVIAAILVFLGFKKYRSSKETTN